MTAESSDPQRPPPAQRISPITFPAEPPALPKPRDDEPQTVRDAFRETSFALSTDIRWLLDALRLQHRIVEQSSHSRYRNRRFASALLFWSRVHRAGVDLLALTSRASYSSCPPLIRAALEKPHREPVVPVVDGGQQRRPAVLGGLVHVGPGVEQHLRGLDIALPGREDQRRQTAGERAGGARAGR